MSLTEVLPDVQALSRTDKLRLIELLAHELADREATLIPENQSYPIWSPDSAFPAAATMLEALSADRGHS